MQLVSNFASAIYCKLHSAYNNIEFLCINGVNLFIDSISMITLNIYVKLDLFSLETHNGLNSKNLKQRRKFVFDEQNTQKYRKIMANNIVFILLELRRICVCVTLKCETFKTKKKKFECI